VRICTVWVRLCVYVYVVGECACIGMSYIVWGVFVHHRTGGMVLPHINDVND
jgi:hypothetical protein